MWASDAAAFQDRLALACTMTLKVLLNNCEARPRGVREQQPERCMTGGHGSMALCSGTLLGQGQPDWGGAPPDMSEGWEGYSSGWESYTAPVSITPKTHVMDGRVWRRR